MSHTSTVNSIAINDITALNSAISELKSRGVNCELLENAKPRAYYSNQEGMGTAPYVVRLTDAKYDIGLYETSTKEYEVRTDFFGGSVENVLGVSATDDEDRAQARLGKLYQAYGTHAAINQAVRQGYNVTRQDKENGEVQLIINV